MPNQREALNEIIEYVPQVGEADENFVVEEEDDGLPNNLANILSGNSVSASHLNNMDEEVIRRRGKRERRYNIITRSMDPMILATRKSPIKRPRSNSSSIEIMSMLNELQKSPNEPKTPVKRAKLSTSPSSPGVTTRKRLNMSSDSGLGSSPSTPTKNAGPSSTPTKSSTMSPSKRKSSATIKAASVERRRRNNRRHNLRRLSS